MLASELIERLQQLCRKAETDLPVVVDLDPLEEPGGELGPPDLEFIEVEDAPENPGLYVQALPRPGRRKLALRIY